MKALMIATVAATLVAGAASAQGMPSGKGNYAGGYLGEYGRDTGTDPMGTTLGPVAPIAPGVVVVDPTVTGSVVTNPGYIPGTPPSGKGNYAGGYRGEAERRLGIGE